MNKDVKILLIAIGVVMADFLFFFLPLAALTVAYVLIQKPKWFKKFVDDLYKDEK